MLREVTIYDSSTTLLQLCLMSRWIRPIVVIGLAVLVACNRRDSSPGDLTLAAQQKIDRRLDRVPQVDTGNGRCLPLWPAHGRLSGTVKKELKLGPPGYGETPAIDERFTVFVLQLDQSVDVCADTASGARLLQRAKAMQLIGAIDTVALKRAVGHRLEVFGSLRRAVWGTDFVDPLIRVDSIPRLQSNLTHST